MREIIALKGAERAARLGDALGLGALVAEWSGAQASLSDESKKLLTAASSSNDISESVIRFGKAKPNASAEELEAHIREKSDEILGKQPSRAAASLSHQIPDQSPVPAPSAVPVLGNLEDALADLKELDRDTCESVTSTIWPELLDLLRAFKNVAEPHERCPACDDGTVGEERLVEAEQILKNAEVQARMQTRRKIGYREG